MFIHQLLNLRTEFFVQVNVRRSGKREIGVARILLHGEEVNHLNPMESNSIID